MKGISFLLGAAVGAVVTYIVVRQYYINKLEDSLDDMREYYIRKAEEQNEDDKGEADIANGDNSAEAKEGMIKQADEDDPSIELSNKHIRIYEDMEEYADSDYASISYTYYSNGVLIDDETEKPVDVEQIKNFIGSIDLDDEFDSRDTNVIYIRNDLMNLDFEVTYDSGDWDTNGEELGNDADRRGET